MKIYHYTSIETLALILESKKIRFNRLDQVDDVEESCYGSGETNIKLGQYQFVSCWTKDNKENLSLWKMYTNYKGVRIALDEDMFITYKVNEEFKSFFPNTIDISPEGDYFISSFINEAKLYDVNYIPNPQDRIKRLIIKAGNNGAAINTNDVGMYKREEWEFQKESRFKITVLPICPHFIKTRNTGNPFDHIYNLMYALGPSIGINHPIKTQYIDIPLNLDKLNHIEVMLGPQTSEGEKTIVKMLLKEYPQSTLFKSYFDGKIKKK